MSYCEAHSYNHEIVSGCPRCLDNKRCLQIGELVMNEEVKDAEIAKLREENQRLRVTDKSVTSVIIPEAQRQAKIEVLKEALEHIKTHQMISAGDMAPMSAIYQMASKALEATK